MNDLGLFINYLLVISIRINQLSFINYEKASRAKTDYS